MKLMRLPGIFALNEDDLFWWCFSLTLFLSHTPATTVPGSTSTKAPAQPAQQAAAPVQAGETPLATTSTPSSVTPQGQLPPQTQAHMPIQSPTSLQVKTQGEAAQLQQTPQVISISGLQQQVQVWSAKRPCDRFCNVPHNIVALTRMVSSIRRLYCPQTWFSFQLC